VVSNGQSANQTTFNNAFASKSADNVLAGKQDLQNADSVSGSNVTNQQREHNGVASFTGRTLNGAKDQLPSWSDNSVGLSTDNLKSRADALTTYAKSLSDNKVTGPASSTDNAAVRFDATTGKLVQNSGVIIDDSNNITGVNNFSAASGTTHALGTSNTATTVNIGTGTGANTINIGGSNSTVTFTGTVLNETVTNLNVTDKLITLNDGGASSSGSGVGFEVEENASATGYIKTSSDRNSFDIKAPNTSGVWSITPGSNTDVIVGKDATQTLTNKTLTTPSTDVITLDGQGSTPSNPSAGFYKVYVDDSTTKLSLLDSNGVVTTVGSGSGTGINYITKPDAEINATTGWSTYADAAGSSPVDGTGGSPNTTWTTSSSSPLRGSYSFLLTKSSGASRQGEGVSYDFTIDAADKGKVLQISFDYSIVSGTFVDDALSVWIYDVTNSTVIQPAPYLIKNHTTSGEKWFGEFQTSSSSTSYRLILHIGVSTNSSNVLKFDNFIVGPQAKLYGSPVTDWVSYTPTGSWSTNTTYTGKWRRIGDSMEVDVKVATSGAPTSAALTINLPSGYSIDTAKIDSNTFSNIFSSGTVNDSTANYYPAKVGYNNTTSVSAIYITSSDIFATITQAAPMTWGASDFLTATFMIPILGWGSSVIMSNDADTRVVVAQITGNPASASSGNPIIVPTVTFDTTGSYNASNGRFTCPSAGFYKMYGMGVSASGGGITLSIYKNAVIQTDLGNTDSNSEITYTGLVSCVAGDLIDIRPSATYDATAFILNIEKISGPSQIAASEDISCKYQNTAGTSITSSAAVIPFSTKIYDSTESFVGSTGIFTAPISGKWRIKSQVYTQAVSNSTSQFIEMLIKVTSTPEGLSAATQSVDLRWGEGISHLRTANGSKTYNLFAGDTLSVMLSNSNTVSLDTTAGLNTIEIERIGN
jgi:hypothetical protein